MSEILRAERRGERALGVFEHAHHSRSGKGELCPERSRSLPYSPLISDDTLLRHPCDP